MAFGQWCPRPFDTAEQAVRKRRRRKSARGRTSGIVVYGTLKHLLRLALPRKTDRV